MVERGSRIGVLKGGLSTEREVSLKTGAAVAGALRRRGWDVVEIDVDRDLPAKLLQHGVQVAWIALHGRFGEDGCVQGLLEVMGIPYTGSDVRSSAVAMDKVATKRALRGVPDVVLAADHVVRAGDALPAELALLVVVKPLVGGSTIGISIAKTREEADLAVREALALHPEVLLEAFERLTNALKQAGRPFFAFLNYFDAHEPYFPPDSVRHSVGTGFVPRSAARSSPICCDICWSCCCCCTVRMLDNSVST